MATGADCFNANIRPLMLTNIPVPALNSGMESFPELLHLAQPLKNPFVYIFSLPWYRHLYMKDTVVHWGQFNWHEGCGRKIGNFYSIGTKSIEVFFLADQKKKPVGPVMQWELYTMLS